MVHRIGEELIAIIDAASAFFSDAAANTVMVLS
jgi:hypothetical protein